MYTVLVSDTSSRPVAGARVQALISGMPVSTASGPVVGTTDATGMAAITDDIDAITSFTVTAPGYTSSSGPAINNGGTLIILTASESRGMPGMVPSSGMAPIQIGCGPDGKVNQVHINVISLVIFILIIFAIIKIIS